MADRKISVCMCTFNGETYLNEQLDSIIAQTCLPNELVVCDDMSTDATPKILEEFRTKAPFPVRVHINAEKLGPVRNFERAIRLCGGDSVFLADQDDVWMPEKLERLDRLLRGMGARYGEATPLMVHTDLEVVNESLEQIAPSFLNYQGIPQDSNAPLSALLIYNFVTGCACAFNRALIDLALPIPKEAIMHDWWIALCAAATGKLEFVGEPSVKYRQHGSNTIGAKQQATKHVLTGEERKVRNDLIRQTVDQASALKVRLDERDQGDHKSRSKVSCYGNILTTPRFLRPFRIFSLGISPPRPGAPAWRKLTRRLRYCYALMSRV